MPRHALQTMLVNTADGRHDRSLRAIEPGYARADDRSLEDLLAFAVRLAPFLNYYGRDDTVQGDWSGFFAGDPILVLASIATTNVRALERELARQARRVRAEPAEQRQRELFEQFCESALTLPRQIDQWLRGLESGPSGRTVRTAHARIAADVRDELRQQMHRLRAWSGRLPPQERDYSAFGLNWSLDAGQAGVAALAKSGDVVHIPGALPQIVESWQSIADAVSRWAAAAPAQIAEVVAEADGRHRPHVALYIAFGCLLQKAQESVNDFAARRAEFYYRRVLRAANLAPVADAVVVAFEPAVSATPVSATIPRGARLPAGKDDGGLDRTFVTCDDVTVTGALLDIVRTVRTVVGPLLPGESGSVIKRVVSRDLTGEAANREGVAAFGRDDDEAAILGFAVGSPALWLRGGTRTIALAIQCALPSTTSDILTRLNLATGLDNHRILEQLLQNAFVVSVSSGSGWLDVEEYAVELSPAQGRLDFSLRFTLSATAPPIAPVPDSPLTAECPAVRVRLRQAPIALDEASTTVAIHPLSVLADLRVSTVDVEVGVEGLTPEVVENAGGRVDITKPFPAFGALPVVGSYCVIRERELFLKDVDALALRVKWFGLPPDDTGFQGYYRGYVLGPNNLPREGLFDNRVFKAAIGGSERYLFRTAGSEAAVPDADGPLSTQSVFEDVSLPRRETDARELRVELIEPPYAFGNGIYAQNALHAALGSRTDASCEASCQAEYAFLLQAARNVEAVLPPLTQTGWRGRLIEAARTFSGLRTRARTVGTNTVTVLASLSDAACESLSACLEEWADRYPAERTSAWRTQLAECRRGSPLERLSACEALRSSLRGAAPGPGAAASPHLQRCDLILNAALWVRDSDDGYSDQSEWHVRRAIRANLTTCVSELRARYEAAVKACTAACAQTTLQFRPNPPHLPQIESLAFDYSARGPATLLAHVLPFDGHRRLERKADADFGTLLPRFAHEGNLYLGFSNLDGPSTLPLYVRFADADGGPLPPISWSYLAGDDWLPLPPPRHDVDATDGPAASGLFALTIPASCDGAPGRVLPGDLRWIRAAVDDAREERRVHGIYPHAVKARRRIDAAGGGDLDRPLPAGTITSLAASVRGIASVIQPAASSGGRAAESDRDLHLRMGERLRHKGRAIVGWDYERLLMERFPTVWKVRALPAEPLRHGMPDRGPGTVRVVAVPGPGSLDVSDPTAPTWSAEALASMARALQQSAGPFVRVRVLNPIFVRVKVVATVRWREGIDPRSAADRLVEDLKAYLSPWDNGIRGDRGISERDVEEFVQSRSSVDAVAALAFEYDPAGALATDPERCFLTTAAVHEIQVEMPAAAAVQQGY